MEINKHSFLPPLKENIEDYTTEELIEMGKRFALRRIKEQKNRDRFRSKNPNYSKEYQRVWNKKKKDSVETINQRE